MLKVLTSFIYVIVYICKENKEKNQEVNKMEEYLISLKFQIKSLRRQIARENRKLQGMSKSINSDISAFSIESYVGFMKVNMDHLVEASTKLAQLEAVYGSLMYEQKQK